MTHDVPAPPRRYTGEPPPGTDPTWDRLQDQLAWYDRRSLAAQHAYKQTKIVQLLLAAGVPVAVASAAPGLVTALLGALVVVLEGIQQLYQWQTNWVLYRSTHESLRHEQFLFLAGAGPYSGLERHQVLAERVEGLVSQEHAKWTEGRHQAVAEPGVGPPRPG
ncbi:DUF4231 domain-containing protein [Geodermatophilus sp. SYSU D00700]